MTKRGQRAATVRRGAGLYRWWRSWRFALRLSGRDARAHRGRSVLIVLLVGLPVLLVGTAATWAATTSISPSEALPTVLGQAQAKVVLDPSGDRVTQLPDGTSANADADALRAPGGSPGAPWTPAQVAQVTGGVSVAVRYPALFASVGERTTRLSVLETDPTHAADTGLTTLVSGRWPHDKAEVVVTEAGRAKGLPVNGTITVRGAEPGPTHELTVVGVAGGWDPDRRPLDVVAADGVSTWADPDTPEAFLVLRPEAVSWADVRQWNAYGMTVTSRQVVLHPPPVSDWPPDLASQQEGDSTGIFLAVLIGVGVLLETTLMAGPAFAVGAARQRRSLALIACNGADRHQLRRYVLSQALLLGGGAALVGGLLGILGGWVAVLVELQVKPDASVGPPDAPWFALIGLAAAATSSALVAALIPARGVSRIAISDVLAGRERSHRLRPGMPVLGGLLVITAVALLIGKLLISPGEVVGLVAVPAIVGMVVGTVLLVPALLGGLGVLAGRLGLATRLAVRDAARRRGRSASAIAAVIVTVSTMTILVVANTSDDRQEERGYQTSEIAGHGYVDAAAGGAVSTVAEIRRQHPDWQILRHDRLGQDEYADQPKRSAVVSLVPAGCSPAQAIARPGPDDPRGCARMGSNAEYEGAGGGLAAVDQVVVGDPLEPAPAAVLERGGMLVDDPAAVTAGRVRIAIGSLAAPGGDQRRVERVVSVPGLAVSAATLTAALRQSSNGGPSRAGTFTLDGTQLSGVIGASAADRLAIPRRAISYEVVDPTGAITPVAEKAVNAHAAEQLTVERGYVSARQPLIWVMLGLGATLVLVAALVATALSQAESQADLATLAALGGSIGLRRRLVASQAVLVAGSGALLGLLAGLLPGFVVALTLTSDTNSDGVTQAGFVIFPWLRLVAVLVGVPLAAAFAAVLAVRRLPPLTRRLT